MLNIKSNLTSAFTISEDIYIKLVIDCNSNIPGAYGYVSVKNEKGDILIESDSFDELPNVLDTMLPGENIFLLKINKQVLPVGKYVVYVNFASEHSNGFNIDSPGNILQFQINDPFTRRGAKRRSYTSQLLKWETPS